MAGIATLSEVKMHLRISHSVEDTIIQVYMDAADERIRTYLNCENPAINPAIKAAFLLFVGDLFENRESQQEKKLESNQAAINLLYPYRENIGL